MPTLRHLAIVVIVIGASACTTWRQHGNAAEAVLGPRPVDDARITLVDGNVVILRDPRVVGDSVVGRQVSSGVSNRVALCIANIRVIETRDIDYWRSAGLAVGTASVLLLTATVLLIVMLLTAIS